ncbi:MAG TPA: serine hydrolase [Symbiobacteriaceae bacterium]|nr:serine hydrolase [Symbiobacteriaceae bacterium]
MQKPLRFWGLLLGVVAAGSMATWGLLLVGQRYLGRPVAAAPVITPTIDQNAVSNLTQETLPAPTTSPAIDPEPTPTAGTGPNLEPVKKVVINQEPPVGKAVPADWAKGPDLFAGVTAAFNGFPGAWSVAVADLTTGERWSVRGDQRYHPASTIKMPVTLYAMTQQKAGRLKWSDVIQYTEGDFESPGGGAFETSPFGEWYPVENLVNRSLIYSNNIAVNMLGRHLGWQNVRDWTRTIDGELFREEDASPSTSALSELGWWRYLYKVSLDDPKTAALVLGPLSKVEFDGRIAAGLPAGVRFVHKFGSLDGNYHDGGIVWAPGHPYALVIMTNGAEVDEADTYIPLVTKAIHTIMSH